MNYGINLHVPSFSIVAIFKNQSNSHEEESHLKRRLNYSNTYPNKTNNKNKMIRRMKVKNDRISIFLSAK
jgi:hypothetical protein